MRDDLGPRCQAHRSLPIGFPASSLWVVDLCAFCSVAHTLAGACPVALPPPPSVSLQALFGAANSSWVVYQSICRGGLLPFPRGGLRSLSCARLIPPFLHAIAPHAGFDLHGRACFFDHSLVS